MPRTLRFILNNSNKQLIWSKATQKEQSKVRSKTETKIEHEKEAVEEFVINAADVLVIWNHYSLD